MCNSIFLDKKTLPKAKEGEEVEIMIKGIYHTDEDGVRTLEVLEADGKPVGGMEEDCGCADAHEELIGQDADDAVRLFFIKTKKG